MYVGNRTIRTRQTLGKVPHVTGRGLFKARFKAQPVRQRLAGLGDGDVITLQPINNPGLPPGANGGVVIYPNGVPSGSSPSSSGFWDSLLKAVGSSANSTLNTISQSYGSPAVPTLSTGGQIQNFLQQPVAGLGIPTGVLLGGGALLVVLAGLKGKKRRR